MLSIKAGFEGLAIACSDFHAMVGCGDHCRDGDYNVVLARSLVLRLTVMAGKHGLFLSNSLP